MDFKIRLAGRNVFIHSVFPYVYYQCCDFLEENSEPDFEVQLDRKQIAAELKRANQFESGSYNLKNAESILLQRIIAEKMLDYNVILMHGAVIAVDNRSYMFVAPSGTGKTTHIKKWLQNVKGSFVVNGDKPFVLLQNNVAYSCGTPWNGKERMGNNSIVPLKGIVFLERSEENHIERVTFRSIFPILLGQTYHPFDGNRMKKRLELLSELKECVTFYKFHINNFKDDAFIVSYNALTNEN